MHSPFAVVDERSGPLRSCDVSLDPALQSARLGLATSSLMEAGVFIGCMLWGIHPWMLWMIICAVIMAATASKTLDSRSRLGAGGLLAIWIFANGTCAYLLLSDPLSSMEGTMAASFFAEPGGVPATLATAFVLILALGCAAGARVHVQGMRALLRWHACSCTRCVRIRSLTVLRHNTAAHRRGAKNEQIEPFSTSQ